MKNNFKRFLSLLLAFVMVIGMFPVFHVHAEEETIWVIGEKVTSVEADETYVICLNGTMNALSNQQGRGDWGTHTLATGACNKYADARIVWTLESVENGFKVKNANGYLNISRNAASLNETGHVIELTYHGDDGWAIKSLDTNEYGNNLGDSGSIGGWSGDGTKFDIYAVTEVSLADVDTFGKMRGLWKQVSVDTETVKDAYEGLFVYAFDNNSNTIWHSNWQGVSDKLTGSNTFSGVIDLGQAYTITRFSFTPRVGNNSGIVTQASLYVKETEDAEWNLVAEHATFAANGDRKDIDFDAQSVRFVMFVAEQSNDGWVAVSEFDVDYIAPAHEHSYEAVVTAPTCEATGYTTHTCECGDSYTTDETAALGHTYDNDRDADCNVCGETREVAPLTRVEQMVAEMSLRDKVTQMMMPDFRKWGASDDTAVDFTVMNDEVRQIIEDYNFGAVIYFANNIKTTDETFALTQEMQAAATKDGGIPLLIAADQEGGSVYRLGSGTALPGNMALGATYTTNGTKYAYEAGKIIGSELSVLGINTNLAPVVDVNNNANNPVIGLRSYSDDATMVGELASASIAGMAEFNVIGCAKHFPGHGDTATDSHYGLPVVDKSLDVLLENELKPYTVAIDQGIEMIMTAHILYPQLESDKILSNKTGEYESLPATMSDDILTGLLKGEMGFEGIVITDAMNMAGISSKWDQVQSVVIAFNAGVDMICMPCTLYNLEDLADLDAIIDGVIAAVEDGTIPMDRINDAVTRILTVKENRGILDYNAEDYSLEKAEAVVGSDENRGMERELTAAAVTVVKNENNVLPLNLTSESKVLMLMPYNNERAQMLMAWNRAVEAGIIPGGAQVDYYRFANATINATLQAKLDWADTYIIITEVSSTSRFSANHWLYAMPTKLVDYAAANGKISVIASCDKPYDVQMYANADAILAAYGCKGSAADPTETLIGGATGTKDAYGPNIIAAVEVALGTFGAQGTLPVNIPKYDAETKVFVDEVVYARGYGLTYEAKVGHEHEYEAVVTDPTCAEDGYTTYECTICDYAYIADNTPATGNHTYDNACDTTCNVCKKVRVVGEHVYDDDKDADCNECGYVRDLSLIRVEKMVAEMSLRDKITQMLMVDFRYWDEDLTDNKGQVGFTVMNDQVRQIIEDYNFGAYIYFAQNLITTDQSFQLTQDLQAAATKDGGIPMLISADQEGGSVYRLGSGTALPGNMALGATYATNGTKYAYEAGKIIGSELGVLGINTNLAPVVDVNNNANNPVIGLRSYSDDATMVGELASAAIAGMAEFNVIGCAKHFPGHGDTATDSHYGLPSVDKSLDVLLENELKPYQVAIDQGIEMIMTAHILYPQLESDKILSNKTGEYESLPATMSDDILTGLLKGEMGFEGIVVTDAMNMAGISSKWDQVQSVVIAFSAGVDMICMPCTLYNLEDLADLDAIIDGVIAAVEDGTIPMERINDAVTRILTVKANRGILDYNAEDYSLEEAEAVVGSDENREMERELAAAAVTVIKNENNVLPLNLTSESKVLMLVPYNNETSQMLMAWNRALEAGLIPKGAQVDYYRFSNATINATLQAKLEWANVIIINSEISSTARMEYKYWLSSLPNKVCDYAAANGKIAIISSVDKPYDVQMYPNANAIVAAYGCKGSSVDVTEALVGGVTGSAAAYGPNIIAAVEVILGTYGAQGKLPVNVPVYDVTSNTYLDEIAYARGYGLTYAAKEGHDHEYGDPIVTAPTCTKDGYTTHECIHCAYSYTTDVTPAIGKHTDSEPVVENEKVASCTEAGSYEIVVYCSACGGEISRDTVIVDALGHNYVAEVIAPTCTTSGYTLYTCSNCGDSYKEDPTEPEHNWDDGVVTAPTCTEQGYTTYTCGTCGETYVDEASWTPVVDHTYEAVVTAPTCTAGGYTTYTCVCGDSYVADQTAALAHTYEAVVTAPTCTEQGFTTYTCACGDSYVADYTAALGHNFVVNGDICACACGEVFEGILNDYLYLNGVHQKAYQLVKLGEDYYFVSDYNKIAKNKNIYLSAKHVEGTDLKVGTYAFDAEGKLQSIWNNGVVNGQLYIDNVLQTAYQLVKFGEDYYFITDYNKIAVNTTIYLTAKHVEGTDLKAGYYEFNAEGKLIVPEQHNGPDADGYFYNENGEKVLGYQVVSFEGSYYFVGDYNKIVKGKTLYVSAAALAGTELKAGYYEFDADGKMIVPETKNGVVDGFLYIDDVKQLAYQLVAFDGSYYFITDGHKVAVNKKVYLSAARLESVGLDLKAGYYEFGADGKLIIG